MKRMSRQDELYEQAAEVHKHALERLARAYEIKADKQSDLLQGIHFSLWQSFARFEGKVSVQTWVYRVADNPAASHVLREHRANAKQWLSLEDVESMPDANMPQESANRRLVLDWLLELIRRLKPVERQLMLLYLEDMDA